MYPIQAVREFNNMTTVAFTFKLKAIEKIKIKFNINININISVQKKAYCNTSGENKCWKNKIVYYFGLFSFCSIKVNRLQYEKQVRIVKIL